MSALGLHLRRDKCEGSATEFSILQASPTGALNACMNAHPIGLTMEE